LRKLGRRREDLGDRHGTGPNRQRLNQNLAQVRVPLVSAGQSEADGFVNRAQEGHVARP
jgi:hypothetical protein